MLAAGAFPGVPTEESTKLKDGVPINDVYIDRAEQDFRIRPSDCDLSHDQKELSTFPPVERGRLRPEVDLPGNDGQEGKLGGRTRSRSSELPIYLQLLISRRRPLGSETLHHI